MYVLNVHPSSLSNPLPEETKRRLVLHFLVWDGWADQRSCQSRTGAIYVLMSWTPTTDNNQHIKRPPMQLKQPHDKFSDWCIHQYHIDHLSHRRMIFHVYTIRSQKSRRCLSHQPTLNCTFLWKVRRNLNLDRPLQAWYSGSQVRFSSNFYRRSVLMSFMDAPDLWILWLDLLATYVIKSLQSLLGSKTYTTHSYI